MTFLAIRRCVLRSLVAAVPMLASAALAQPCTPSWTQLTPQGLNDAPNALVVFNDGTGSALYAGGSFTTAGGNAAARVAKWNGQAWSNLGLGITGGPVSALIVFDDGTGPALYAGGSFTTAGGNSVNHIAKWNGQAWSAVGAGISDNVLAFGVYNDGTGPALYAGGGLFTPFGSHGFVNKWTGSTWVSVGGGVNSVVNALTVFNDGTGNRLYAGGSITQAGGAGGVTVSGIASWNGSQWAALGQGVNGSVNTLLTFDSGDGPGLYVGGGFSTAGTTSASNVARWTTSWSALGAGSFRTVYSLESFNDGTGAALYLAAGFNAGPFGTSTGYVSKWDGVNWNQVGGTMNLPVQCLGVFNDGRSALFAGGQFTTIDGSSYPRIARWGCPPLPPCGSADFNCDGDVGTDADIEAFFACLSGSCPPPPCTSNADFNSDGDVGTDGDIEAFFRVLGGGTC
jgi:hypothetical protein